MNEDMGYLIFQICFLVSIAFILMYWAKYHYISTICYKWNKKLYRYIGYLESQKDSEIPNLKYLHDMYIYPDTIGIRLFNDWKESDLILDKLTLFNVNQVNDHLKNTDKC